MKELFEKFLGELGFFTNFEQHVEPDSAVEEGEKVIGEMNEMEKCLFTLIDLKRKEHHDLIDRIRLIETKEEEVALAIEHEQNHLVEQFATSIMWSSIKSRLKTSSDSTGVGVRKGFVIVEYFEVKEEVSAFEIVLGMRV